METGGYSVNDFRIMGIVQLETHLDQRQILRKD